jgi:uncharacterized RDD family membrane protein YckC
MKCPKCQYISFDSGDRCRNCGYEFSLAADAGESSAPPSSELALKDGTEALGPLADFPLTPTPNLPLFTSGDPDAPLVAPRATPRVPLAVRKTAPVSKPKARRDHTPAEPRLALDTADLGPAVAEAQSVEAETIESTPAVVPADNVPSLIASSGARLAGGAIDLLLVGGMDLAVLYLTLRVCDLTFGEVAALPVAPLVAFLVLLNGGYLSTFVAATGQTIGKMAAGTRVVPADSGTSAHDRVTFGQSSLRAAAYVVSALPLGLGFVPALAGGDRRALHDRLADTRVVKA